MELNEIRKEIEALMFVQGEVGVTPFDIKVLFDLSVPSARKILKQFAKEFNEENHGIQVLDFNDYFKFATRPEYNEMISNFVTTKRKNKLSQAAIETVGIIAYKQPITRGEINKIRGIISDGTVSTLLAKELIEEKGIANTIGKPILYGITNKFYDYFQISSLNELPKIKELMDEDEETSFDLMSSQRQEE
ncbi:MAG: SMC-Scp complex subunit ScpB [Mycoplasma sp.]|nr:SMC-Scp complex subunit ScpB [Mycoplasma sp.]